MAGRTWMRTWLACALTVNVSACDHSTPDEPMAGQALRTTTSELPKPLVYEARGIDFKWSFVYAGPDGDLGTTDDVPLGHTLIVPSGKDVELQLVSDDYVYILAAPGTGQREIAVPDMTHTLIFDSGAVRELDLITDPLCGYRFFHDEVMGRVRVVPLEQFSARLDAAP